MRAAQKKEGSLLHAPSTMKLLKMHRAENEKNTMRINKIYALTLVAGITFLLVGIAFIYRTTNLSREETIGYVQAATEQTQFAIDEHIQEEFDTLMMAAVVAQDKDLLGDDEVLGSLVEGLGTHNDYVRIGFTDAGGQAVWADLYGRKRGGDMSAEGFVQRALTGENAVSRVRYDEVSRQHIYYYAVPVYNTEGDSVEGVLFAADSQEELRKVVDHSLYAGEGLAHIIDDEGNYIVKSNSPLGVGIGDNIFELKEPVDEELRQEMLGHFAARKAGHHVRGVYGEKRLVAYAPLDTNDWYVFYAVPESAVSAGLRNVVIGTTLIVGIAAAVFVLFIWMIRRINRKNREALEVLAFVDPMTGHRNFHKFLLDAGEILRNANGTRYAVYYGDIKDFKNINDMFGRDVGDRLLRYMADFLESISQEGEASARISENAFVALRKVKSRKEIELRFESVSQHLAVFPETLAHGYRVELYAGVYVLEREDGDLTLNDMLDRAITAQEEAQFSGGIKRFGFYSNKMREQKLWETEVESTMEAALENDEFRVYLQPKIDIQHGDCIAGAEALVRWVSPERGVIPPGRFIGLFERNGFIVELDRYLFDKVCRFYRENDLDNGPAPCVLSVNVSRLGLMRPDFVEIYAETRKKYDIPDGCIELEFTESLAFGDLALFKTVVAACKNNGFLCSMDDFGAGYSSLNMLKSIPVDVLKMDRQFFLYEEDPEEMERGRQLVRNIVAMAKALHMKTVAEGIDVKGQVEQLRAMGCNMIQGYVFAKPMPAEEFVGFVESWTGMCGEAG